MEQRSEPTTDEIVAAIRNCANLSCSQCICSTGDSPNMSADLCHSDRLADRLESQQREIERLNDELVRITNKLSAETARADAAVAELSGNCGSCKFSNDCAKHDNNDSSAGYTWFTDCDDWEWHYDDESAIS